MSDCFLSPVFCFLNDRFLESASDFFRRRRRLSRISLAIFGFPDSVRKPEGATKSSFGAPVTSLTFLAA